MFTDDVIPFLESGCALIVATVSADREPHAARGWGLDVVSVDDVTVQLLLDADDARIVDDLAADGEIAITGADVRTLRSVQLKGRAFDIEPATAGDRRRARRYCDGFFLDIHETDGTAFELLERLVPRDYLRCRVVVEELFDQTPGPGAGAPIGREAP